MKQFIFSRFLVAQSGACGDTFSDISVLFSMFFQVILLNCFSEVFLGFRDPPQQQNNCFAYTKPLFSHFNLDTQKNGNFHPMGTLLGTLGLQNAENGGPESIKKVTPKIAGKKSCGSRNFMQDGPPVLL